MTEQEATVKVTKNIMTTILLIGVSWIGACSASKVYEDKCKLDIAQINATANGRAAAEANAASTKAAADRAMFESMTKGK